MRALPPGRSLDKEKQFRTGQSKPEPDKEAGSQVTDKQSHAKANQDKGRNDESILPVFPGFYESALHFYLLCIGDFSTTLCFHG
jgi:hypothetical protein